MIAVVKILQPISMQVQAENILKVETGHTYQFLHSAYLMAGIAGVKEVQFIVQLELREDTPNDSVRVRSL